MASTKRQCNTMQNQLKNKMEVSKPKVGVGPIGIGRTNRVLCGADTGSLKVYSQNEDVDANSRIRKSMPHIKTSTMASTGVRKGVLNSTEMGKTKSDGLAKPVAGRRALADVSNVRGISSSNGARNTLKPPFKVSTNPGTRTMNVSSRKSIQGGLNQVVSESHLSKKVGVKDLKAHSDSQRNTATGLNRESIAANSRRTTRTSLIPTRKSLLVLKRVNQAGIPKENSGSSRATKVEIKVAVGRKVVARVSTGRTHLRRNRASDGFLIMRQNAVDSGSLPRKSIMLPVKNVPKASDATKKTKSNQANGPNKLAMVATTLPKNNQETTTFSHCESITEESIHTQASSEGDCKPSTSDAVPKKSSRRRRSYTSSLMEGNKLVEHHCDVTEQDKLASIDDEGNQLEVADYVDEIYQYYWVTEAQMPSMENYMSIQMDITPHLRAVLINWLIEVHFKYDLMQETLYLMITLLDRYLSEVVVKKNEMQLVGLTALLLASKYEDYWHPKVHELVGLCTESYTRDQMLEMEKLILKKLKFRLNTATPYVFMLRFLKAAQSDKKLEHLAFYLVDLCLVEYEALKFKPSLLCASAIYVARCTLQITPSWTPLLRRHARYDVLQLRECADMVLQFHKAARKGQLKVTHEKYTSPDMSGVAAMKPLERLPH